MCVDEFDCWFLLLLNEYIDFDGVWFGYLSLWFDGLLLYSVYLYNLCLGFMYDWE